MNDLVSIIAPIKFKDNLMKVKVSAILRLEIMGFLRDPIWLLQKLIL